MTKINTSALFLRHPTALSAQLSALTQRPMVVRETPALAAGGRPIRVGA